MTLTTKATYERGTLRLKRKLPIKEHTVVTVIWQPTDPVSRTRGALRVPKRLAKILIYDDSLLE